VAVIGREKGGNGYFEGRFDDPFASNSNTWAGQVIDGAGFNNHNPNTQGPQLVEYNTNFEVPTIGTCPYAYCQAWVWCGLVGYGSGSGNLIQNGFIGSAGSSGSSPGVLFYEINPGAPVTIMANQLPSGAIGAGQTISIGGFPSDQNTTLDPSGGWATFGFSGYLPGDYWAIYPVTLKQPANTQFVGWTAEAIVEVPNAPNSSVTNYLANFGTIEFVPAAYDINDNGYTDESADWIFLNMTNSANSHLLAYPYFYGDPYLTPPAPFTSDPWDTSHTTDPFYVEWLNYQ
jgi:hypothetical protein